jgi:hypothetical protein
MTLQRGGKSHPIHRDAIMRISRHHRKTWQLALVVVASMLGATEATAQFGGGFGPGRMGPPGGGNMEGRPQGRPAVTASGSHLIPMIEQQLVEARTQLGIRPEQESLWGAYQGRVGALLADQLRPRPANEPQGDAMQQIERKIDTVRNRLTAIEDIAEVAHKLYASLDNAQKEKADRILAATIPALYTGLAGDRMDAPPKMPGSPGERIPGSGAPFPRQDQ